MKIQIIHKLQEMSRTQFELIKVCVVCHYAAILTYMCEFNVQP